MPVTAGRLVYIIYEIFEIEINGELFTTRTLNFQFRTIIKIRSGLVNKWIKVFSVSEIHSPKQCRRLEDRKDPLARMIRMKLKKEVPVEITAVSQFF